MTEPTVYGYMDLADKYNVPNDAFRVPVLAPGPPLECWVSTESVRAARKALTEHPERGCFTVDGTSLVMGDEALRVAEREVREAVADDMREVYKTQIGIREVERDTDGTYVVRWSNGGGSQVDSKRHPRLARAVDLRDRLRAKRKVGEERKTAGWDGLGVDLGKLDAETRGRILGGGWSADTGVKPSHVVHMNATGRPTDPVAACGALKWVEMTIRSERVTCEACMRRGAKPSQSAERRCACGHPRYMHRYAWSKDEAPRDCTDRGCACAVFEAKPATTRETQPVFLATLRVADGRDPVNPNAPWVIQGERGWVWRLTHVQVFKLKRDGKVEDTRCNRIILFVAQDWKPKLHVAIDASSMEEIRKDVDVNAQEVKLMPAANPTVAIGLDTREVIDKLNEVKALAKSLGREVCKPFNPPQEDKPMPEKPAPKPDRIEVHAVRENFGDLVTLLILDRSRRTKRALVPAGVSRTTHPDEMNVSVRWVEVEEGQRVPAFLRVSMDSLDNKSILTRALAEILAMSYATLPPLVIEGTSPQACEKIAEDFKREQPGRSVVVLPNGAHVADAPPEPDRPEALDISRRADLAAASKKAWRWGLIVGAIIMLAGCVTARVIAAKLRPEWFAPRQHASESLKTPWSPAVLDEHARESEDAREGGK